jgi:hypothetical protein
MADQIVSWGGFNSKGTSGMGVTGSFSVSGSSNFSPNISITGSATIDGIGSSEGFLEINSSQNDQNSALYFYENPNGLGRTFGSIIRYVGNGNTLRYLTKSGTETEYLRQSAGNSTFKQSVYVGDLQSLGSLGDSPFDVYATPAGNGMVGTLRKSGTGDVMMGFHQWGGTAYAIGAISGNNGFGFFNGRYSAAAGTEVARFSGNNNLLIGTTTDSARLTVKGSGTTSSTTSFLVQNSAGSTALQVKDDRTTTFGAPIYLSGNQGYIYYGTDDYIQFPRQGGPAPGYFSTSTAGDGWAFRLGSNNQTYARIMEGSFYLEAYTPSSNGRNSIRTWFSGSNFVYIDGDGVTGRSPSYGNGVNVVIRGGKSGTYENIDNRGAAGYVTVEGGSAFSGSSTTHITGAGVNIQTGLGLGTGSAADLTFSTSATSSVASVYHTLPQRMIIKGQTGFVGIGTSTPSASLHVSGAFLGYPVTVPTASGTASLDCNLGNFFNLTLSSSYTLFLSASNVQPGQTINLRVTQPAISGSLNYGSQFKFAGGIPYSASATGSAVDIISFITFDTTNLYGSAIKNLS